MTKIIHNLANEFNSILVGLDKESKQVARQSVYAGDFCAVFVLYFEFGFVDFFDEND